MGYDTLVADGNAPRPRNRFIIFRSHFVDEHRGSPGLNALALKTWHDMGEEGHAYWQHLATLEKQVHAQRYPDYCYGRGKPCSRGKKPASSPTSLPPPAQSPKTSSRGKETTSTATFLPPPADTSFGSSIYEARLGVSNSNDMDQVGDFVISLLLADTGVSSSNPRTPY
ncbi:hypothetical protein B0H16DRAFT_1742947 [Mycena metata]|nr:hypothetical protein B0H16DRAFT_1742947 [Mycena metata]